MATQQEVIAQSEALRADLEAKGVSEADIGQTINAFLQATPVTSSDLSTTSTVTGETITSDDLSSGSGGITFPDSEPVADLGELRASAEGVSDEDLLNFLNQEGPEEQALEKSEDELGDIFKSFRDEGAFIDSQGNIVAPEFRATQEEKEGVDTLKAELTELGSDLTSLRLERSAIPLQIQEEFTGRGATREGIQTQQIGRLRQNAIKTLQTAAIFNAKKGEYSLALDRVDRAVEAKFAPMVAELNYRQAVYDLSKDALERADKKKADQFALKLAKQERILTQAFEEEKDINHLALIATQKDAPLALVKQIQKAGSYAEAMQIAGPYARSKEDDLRIELIQEQIKTQRQSQESSRISNLIALAEAGNADAISQLGLDPTGKKSLSQKDRASVNEKIVDNPHYEAIVKSQTAWGALQGYKELVEEMGAVNTLSFNEKKKANSVYTTSLLELKEFYNLGVLNGPDLDVMEDMVPLNVKGNIASFTSGLGLGIQGTPASVSIGQYTSAGLKNSVLFAIENQRLRFESKLDDDYLALRSSYHSQYDSSDLPILDDIDRRYIQMKTDLAEKPGEENPIKMLMKENPDLTTEEIIMIINNKLN